MKLTYIVGLLAVTVLASAKMEVSICWIISKSVLTNVQVKRGADQNGSLDKAIQSGQWIEDLWGAGNYPNNGESKGESKQPEEGKKEGNENKESSEPSKQPEDNKKETPAKQPEENQKESPKEPESGNKEKGSQGQKDKCGYTPEEKEKFIASGKYDPCLFN